LGDGFHTGDIVVVDEKGYITIVDRQKAIAKISPSRLHSAWNVQRCALSVRAVQNAAEAASEAAIKQVMKEQNTASEGLAGKQVF
jgi:acyl-coenzyme A synthetase/AMP-(fatty) acid ligase